MKKARESEQPGVPHLPPLLLRQVELSEAAGSALSLLFCSFDEEMLNENRGGVRLFELVDVAAGDRSAPVAAALTVDVDADTVEMQRYTVNRCFPSRLTGRLISGIADRLRAAGASSLLVAAPTDVEEIGELWSAGFRKALAGCEWLELSL